jgi:hypothetical protein
MVRHAVQEQNAQSRCIQVRLVPKGAWVTLPSTSGQPLVQRYSVSTIHGTTSSEELRLTMFISRSLCTIFLKFSENSKLT